MVVPAPGYPPFSAFPAALGLELRTYGLRPENRFQPDLDEIEGLIDERTRILLVNNPHNGVFAEALAEVAIRNRTTIFQRARAATERNLALLDSFFDEHAEILSWVRPQGGFTAFPRLTSGEDTRPLCQRTAERGVLFAPGDCFGHPSHLRLGFGKCEAGFGSALEVFSSVLKE